VIAVSLVLGDLVRCFTELEGVRGRVTLKQRGDLDHESRLLRLRLFLLGRRCSGNPRARSRI
jgi:hypothetical protein